MAKSADAKDLKSFSPQGECGFKSRPGHQPNFHQFSNLWLEHRLFAAAPACTPSPNLSPNFGSASQFSATGSDVFALSLTTWREVIQQYFVLRRQNRLKVRRDDLKSFHHSFRPTFDPWANPPRAVAPPLYTGALSDFEHKTPRGHTAIAAPCSSTQNIDD